MNKLAPLFIIAAAILWGIDGIILRPTLYSLPVPNVVFIESLIVSIYLFPILITKRKILKSLTVSDWLNFLGVALFGGVLGIMGITKALFYVNYVNLSIVILIQKLQPIFAITFAIIILKEKLNPAFIYWAILALIGAYIMTFGFTLPTINTNDKTLYASLYALLAAFSFGLSTVLSKRILSSVGFKLATYIRFLLSTFLMLIVITSFGNFQTLTAVSSSQFLTFLLIAFTTGGPAMFLYYYGLKFTSASSSTILELAFPLTAILLEYFIRGNILGFVQWVGVVILLVSITKVAKLKRS
ncbi:MAG: DMT family transporter [Melioribacteraceae bacterium]